jgi:hypothetical protein
MASFSDRSPSTVSSVTANTAPVYKSHLEQLYDTFSVRTLAEWLQQNGQKMDKLLLRKDEETFVDGKGVKRYVKNWQRVEELSRDEEDVQLFEKTGCIRVKVGLVNRDIIENANEIKSINEYEELELDMLNDWQRLWSFFYADEEDEVAIHAPFLRLLIECFFHRRTCHLMIILFIYNLTCFITTFMLYKKGVSELIAVCYILSAAIQLIVYFACLVLIKGKRTVFSYLSFFSSSSISSPSPNPTANLSTPSPSSQSSQPVQYYSIHLTGTVTQLYRCAYQEAAMIFFPQSKTILHHRNRRLTSHKSSVSFYRIFNMSLKILTRFGNINTKATHFDRPTYRYALLFVTYFLPFYIFINDYMKRVIEPAQSCARDIDHPSCRYELLFLVITIGYSTTCLYHYCFAASVMITLVSLAYAGEAVYQLIHSWIKKFRSLRRVKPDDNTCRILTSKRSEAPQCINHDDRRANESWNSSEGRENEVISILHQQPAKEVQMVLKKDASSPPTALNTVESEIEEEEAIDEYIKIDATEHYLLIREIVRISSTIWSPALTGFFFLTCYGILSYFAYFILFSSTLDAFTWFYLIIYMSIRIFVFCIYPIISISHANSYLYELLRMFEGTAGEDYLVLGGRKYWISFIEICPIVWTYYGIWMTYDRLQGLVYTSVAGIVALISGLISTQSLLKSIR